MTDVETKKMQVKCPNCGSSHIFTDNKFHRCLRCKNEWLDNELCSYFGMEIAELAQKLYTEDEHTGNIYKKAPVEVLRHYEAMALEKLTEVE